MVCALPDCVAWPARGGATQYMAPPHTYLGRSGPGRASLWHGIHSLHRQFQRTAWGRLPNSRTRVPLSICFYPHCVCFTRPLSSRFAPSRLQIEPGATTNYIYPVLTGAYVLPSREIVLALEGLRVAGAAFPRDFDPLWLFLVPDSLLFALDVRLPR